MHPLASTRLNGHTPLDGDALIAAGVDPSTTQPRERPVRCCICGTPTWHQMGGCDRHHMAPHAARQAVTA